MVRAYYAPFDSAPRAGSARLYQHEIPGGQFTNLREQAAAMGLGHRWREVERTYAEVNRLFGDIVKVTPSSKVVGDMALFLMSREMRPQDVLKLDVHHDVSFPNSVVEMFRARWACRRAVGRRNYSRLFCVERSRIEGGRAQCWSRSILMPRKACPGEKVERTGSA